MVSQTDRRRVDSVWRENIKVFFLKNKLIKDKICDDAI